LSDDQLTALRAAAAPLAVEQRAGFLRVIAHYLALEGGVTMPRSTARSPSRSIR
jgi:hypothetical protein